MNGFWQLLYHYKRQLGSWGSRERYHLAAETGGYTLEGAWVGWSLLHAAVVLTAGNYNPGKKSWNAFLWLTVSSHPHSPRAMLRDVNGFSSLLECPNIDWWGVGKDKSNLKVFRKHKTQYTFIKKLYICMHYLRSAHSVPRTFFQDCSHEGHCKPGMVR